MTRVAVRLPTPLRQEAIGSQSNYLVQDAAGNIWCVFISATNSDLYYTCSSDGGLTWNNPFSVIAGTVDAVSVWYDRWTPGNSGNLIHMAYMESGTDDVWYRNIDVTTGSLGTQVQIQAITSNVVGANQCISITRAIGGNLYVAYDSDGGTETGFERSTDVGATWTARTNVNEATSTDYYLLAPGFAADNQDIICVFWDRSANEISRKLYDDSANTWGETSIATSMTALASSTAAPQFAVTVDDANNKILLAAWSAADLANADLRFWSIDETTITEGTNVVLDSVDDQGMCALALNTETADIYCFYGGLSDGSQTFPTNIFLYYKVSADGGSTWGAETRADVHPTVISAGAQPYVWMQACPLFTGSWLLKYMLTSGVDGLFVSADTARARPTLLL